MVYMVELKPIFLKYELESKVLKEPKQQQESIPWSREFRKWWVKVY